MIDHISILVFNFNFEKTIKFYDETLSILGFHRTVTFETPEHRVGGYGREQKTNFWISTGKGDENLQINQNSGFHIAFTALSKEVVDKWHAAALEAGGKDNGQPGVRTHYHPGYYGAFIIDPNGWRIETCIHDYQPELETTASN